LYGIWRRVRRLTTLDVEEEGAKPPPFPSPAWMLPARERLGLRIRRPSRLLSVRSIAALTLIVSGCLPQSAAVAELRATPITLGYGKTAPAIAPDGRRLAFGWTPRDRSRGDVFMIDVTDPDTSKAPTRLAYSEARDHEPCWSPDGTRIAFFSGRSGDEDIWVYSLATEEYAQLTTSPWGPSYRAQEFGPAWSPDGKRIAFSSDRSGDDDIWWVPADGGDMVRVTKRTLPLSRDQDRFPSWSPDSKRVVYASKTSGNWDLWIAVVDDTTIAPVQITADSTDEWFPAWSPNGRWLAFVSNRSGSGDIFVMRADGGAAKRVTRNPAPDLQPCWSPDGRRIYYCASRESAHGIWAIDGLEDLLGEDFAARTATAANESGGSAE